MFIIGVSFGIGMLLALVSVSYLTQQRGIKGPRLLLSLIYMLLAGWLLYLSLLSAGLSKENDTILSWYFPIDFTIAMLLNPLFFHYIHLLFEGRNPLRHKTIYFHFIPTLLSIVYNAIYLTTPPHVRIKNLLDNSTSNSYWYTFMLIVFGIQSVIYLILCCRKIIKMGNPKIIVYKKKMILKTLWIKMLIGYYISSLFVFFICKMSSPQMHIHIMFVQIILCILALFFIATSLKHTGQVIKHNEEIFKNNKDKWHWTIDTNKQEKIEINEAEYKTKQAIIDSLISLMESKKIYLQAKCPINDIAKQLDITPKQLSNALKVICKQNYNEFINNYRINHSIHLIQNGAVENMTLEAIAKASGFGSKTTFFEAFRKTHNTSPFQYHERLKTTMNRR